MTNLAEERTLILVKPDGVSSHHVGEIITRIERKGYEIEALKVVSATEDQLKQHYNDKVDKPYFPDMLSYMQSGPIVGRQVQILLKQCIEWLVIQIQEKLNLELSVEIMGENGLINISKTWCIHQIV